MNTDAEFEGHDRIPSGQDFTYVMLIIDYLKTNVGIELKEYHAKNPDVIGRNKVKNARSSNNQSFSREEFRVLTKHIFEILIQTRNQRYYLLDLGEPFINSIVLPFFPLLKQVISDGLIDGEPSLMTYATTNHRKLQDFRDRFANGAFIYRYAKNSLGEHTDNPRIARGFIEFKPEIYEQHLKFSMTYKPKGNDYTEVTNGRIYLIHSYAFFVGIGVDFTYPFFMTLHANLIPHKKGAIVMRKHDKGYFVSKVMLCIQNEPHCNPEQAIGLYSENELLEEGVVTDEDLKSLINSAQNEGKSGLFIPDFES